MNLTMNIGTLDRGLRMVVGFGLMALAYVGTIPAWAGYVGVIPLATGLAGFCPLYRFLGVSTGSTQP